MVEAVGYEVKLGDIYRKLLTVNQALHGVVAYHFAYATRLVAARHVLITIARLQHGLLAHHAFAFYLAPHAGSIKNLPEAAL